MSIQEIYQSQAKVFLSNLDQFFRSRPKNFQHYCIRSLAVQVSRLTSNLEKWHERKTTEKSIRSQKRKLENDTEMNKLKKRSVEEIIDIATTEKARKQ